MIFTCDEDGFFLAKMLINFGLGWNLFDKFCNTTDGFCLSFAKEKQLPNLDIFRAIEKIKVNSRNIA